MNTETKAFVDELSNLLTMAKPNLIKSEYKLGKEIDNLKQTERVMPDDEYVVVNCKNGHRYFVNISGNSLAATAYQVFNEMMGK